MNKIKLMLFIILLAGGISCRQESANISEKGKAAARSIDRSHIVYNTQFEYGPITEEELNDLRNYINENTSPSQEVWFVSVYAKFQDYLRAEIYLKPEQTNGRIRKGYYLSYNSFSKKLRNTKWLSQDAVQQKFAYVQVASQDSSFDEQLGKPTQDSMFPFIVHDGFSDQEIIEIVDFVRSGPTVKPKEQTIKRANSGIDPNDIKENDYSSSLFTGSYWSSMFTSPYTQNSHPVPGEAIQYESTEIIWHPEIHSNEPIIYIERDGEFINIMTGTSEGSVSGSGQGITIKKTDDGYELVSVGIWNS
ncbi:MAG: hypothetical protein ABFD91_03110 [Anaerohalosphaeraceae bacterium]